MVDEPSRRRRTRWHKVLTSLLPSTSRDQVCSLDHTGPSLARAGPPSRVRDLRRLPQGPVLHNRDANVRFPSRFSPGGSSSRELTCRPSSPLAPPPPPLCSAFPSLLSSLAHFPASLLPPFLFSASSSGWLDGAKLSTTNWRLWCEDERGDRGDLLGEGKRSGIFHVVLFHFAPSPKIPESGWEPFPAPVSPGGRDETKLNADMSAAGGQPERATYKGSPDLGFVPNLLGDLHIQLLQIYIVSPSGPLLHLALLRPRLPPLLKQLVLPPIQSNPLDKHHRDETTVCVQVQRSVPHPAHLCHGERTN